jgi:purine-binding chemotaxis protein CheW
MEQTEGEVGTSADDAVVTTAETSTAAEPTEAEPPSDPDEQGRDESLAEGSEDAGDAAEESGVASREGADGAQAAAEPAESEAETETAEGEAEAAISSGSVSAPLPDEEQLEAALDGTDPEDSPDEVEPAGVEESAETGKSAAYTETEEQTRVLEFTLDDEYYCLNIEYIEEIVKQETITRVPNTPDYVEGVVDLRGQITTILNPKVTVGKENDEASELIVVFDDDAFDDQGYIGWVVDDVRQVSPVTDSQVNDPPIDQDHVNGVIDREDDDQFVIWTTPKLALAEE